MGVLMLDMCPVELERHPVRSSDRCDTYPMATRDYVEQMRRKYDPMEIDEMAYPAEEEGNRSWEGVHATRCSKGKGKGKSKGHKLRMSFASCRRFSQVATGSLLCVLAKHRSTTKGVPKHQLQKPGAEDGQPVLATANGVSGRQPRGSRRNTSRAGRRGSGGTGPGPRERSNSRHAGYTRDGVLW